MFYEPVKPLVYVFKNDDGQNVTINGERYIDILYYTKFLLSQLVGANAT